MAYALADTPVEIPPEHDPRLVDGPGTQRKRLAQLNSAQRAALVLERYPELRALPNCDWQRLSLQASFSILFGESARHYAHLELAALAGVLASAGVSAVYTQELELTVRRVLASLQQRFGITTPRAITLDVWEAWGRDTDLMRTLTQRVAKYAAAVNLYLGDYRERLSPEDQACVSHLLLPPLPNQFRVRFVPGAERRVEVRRNRKAKTDVVSECAMAILALMLARYPSMERFIHWYRQQIERIEAGELSVPARLVYEDNQLDLPSQPGPDAVSVEELRWRTTPVHLELTIWRPYEFSQRRTADRIQHAVPGTKEWVLALAARSSFRGRAKQRIHADPHTYFAEVHPTEAMPWFMGPVGDWFARFARIPGRSRAGAGGGTGQRRAGVGTPESRLAKYFSVLFTHDRHSGRNPMAVGVCFDPESTYRGVLFGTAIVTLMLTADARIHEILQISADRFVKPVRVYIVKNPDGTPKYDPLTNKIVTDVIVEQRLLPEGRKRDDLRLQYDVSAARVHLQEITRLLTSAHGGQIPTIAYDPQHSKAEHLGAERYLFQWKGRHLSTDAINSLIRLVLHGVALVDRSGERISVTSHLLRHAAATVQRQQYGVPLEILAEAMGHTLAATGKAPEATRYYSQMTETQKAEIRHDTIVAMLDDARLAVRVIEPEEEAQRIQRLMAEADEQTREVLERYGGLHPVTFGHCGYPGLCVRGTTRAFCIGCPFLVRRPEYIDRVDFFLDGYAKAADTHERMGDLAGARERHRLIAQLKQLRSRDAAAGRSRTARSLDAKLATGAIIAGWIGLKMSDPEDADPFAHLKQQATERSDRTVQRITAGIAALRADGRKITAESLKQATRELEPGFAGLSFQVIRRNPRAYALYREAADAFFEQAAADNQPRPRRRRRIRGSRTSRSSYDPLQRFDKKELVQRIRSVEVELNAERRRRSALAYDQQALLAKMIRLETEIILLQADKSHPD